MAHYQYQRYTKPILPLAKANVKQFQGYAYPDQCLPKNDYSSFPCIDSRQGLLPIVQPKPPAGSWHPEYADFARDPAPTHWMPPTDTRTGLVPFLRPIKPEFVPKVPEIIWNATIHPANLNGWSPQNLSPIVKPQPPKGSWYPHWEDIARDALNWAAWQPHIDTKQGVITIRQSAYGWPSKYPDLFLTRELHAATLNGWSVQNLVPIPRPAVISGWQGVYADFAAQTIVNVAESSFGAPLQPIVPTIVQLAYAESGQIIRGRHVQYQQFAQTPIRLATGATMLWYPSFPDAALRDAIHASVIPNYFKQEVPLAIAPTQFGSKFADQIPIAPVPTLGNYVSGFIPIPKVIIPLGPWQPLWVDAVDREVRQQPNLQVIAGLPIPEPIPPTVLQAGYPDFAVGPLSPVNVQPQYHFTVITNVPVMSWTGSFPDLALGPQFPTPFTLPLPPQVQKLLVPLSWAAKFRDMAPGPEPVTHTNAVWLPRWSFPSPPLAWKGTHPDYIFGPQPVIVNLGGQVVAIWPIPAAHLNQYVGLLLCLGVG